MQGFVNKLFISVQLIVFLDHFLLLAELAQKFKLLKNSCIAKWFHETELQGNLITFITRGSWANFYQGINTGTAKKTLDNSVFFSIKPKLDMRLFVYFCGFTRFWLNLLDINLKLFVFLCSEQFKVPIRQIQSKTGKNIEITKQLHVQFWINRKKNMELSCTY